MSTFVWTFSIMSACDALIAMWWLAQIATGGEMPERSAEGILLMFLGNLGFAVWGFILLGR